MNDILIPRSFILASPVYEGEVTFNEGGDGMLYNWRISEIANEDRQSELKAFLKKATILQDSEFPWVLQGEDKSLWTLDHLNTEIISTERTPGPIQIGTEEDINCQ